MALTRFSRFLCVLSLFTVLHSKAQVIIVPEVQTDGVIMKQQLWSCLIQNAETRAIQAVLVVSIADRQTSQVLSETSSSVLTLPTGMKRISIQEQAPLSYGVTSLGFAADRPLNQPLPVGEYQVCYRLIEHRGKQTVLASECIRVISEPLSPPQLIQPEDGTTVMDARPSLSWTPPAPVHMFTSLQYELKVVALYDNQSPSEALQRNIPVLVMPTQVNSVAYPASYSNLEPGKKYAWQVVALDAGRPGGQSEAWSFTVMPDSVVQIVNAAPFIRMETKPASIAVIHQGFLKIEYVNVVSDTTLKIDVRPAAGSRKRNNDFSTTVSLRPGQNFLQVNLNGRLPLKENIVYEVSVTSESGATRKLQFQTFNYL